jgi:hypothetical protein
MSKFDSLLKQVELFERLADYGDRTAFLRSLSQALPAPSLTGPTVPTPGTPGTPGGRPLSLSEKLKGQTDPRYIELNPGEGDPNRYIELDPGEGEPVKAPVSTQPVSPAPSLSGATSPKPGAPGTPGGRPLTLSEKLKGPPYPAK